MAVHQVSKAALRRIRLPTATPAGFHTLDAAIDALPDPELLCAEERAAALAALARHRNRIDAYLSALAGAAERAGDGNPGCG